MKKFLLVIGLFLCSFGVNAQMNPCLGLKATAGMSNITNDDKSFDFKPSFGIGGTCQFTISPNFAIQPEIFISFKGAKTTQEIPIIKDLEIKYDVAYIEIPILFKGIFGSNSVFVGPYFAFALNSQIDFSGLYTQKTEDFVKSSDIGITGGYERYFSRNFSADVRFNYGLSEIFEVKEFPEITNYFESNFKNYSIMLGLNYYFK